MSPDMLRETCIVLLFVRGEELLQPVSELVENRAESNMQHLTTIVPLHQRCKRIIRNSIKLWDALVRQEGLCPLSIEEG